MLARYLLVRMERTAEKKTICRIVLVHGGGRAASAARRITRLKTATIKLTEQSGKFRCAAHDSHAQNLRGILNRTLVSGEV